MQLPPKHVRFTHAPLDYKKKEIRLLKIKQDFDSSNPILVTLENVDFSAYLDSVAGRDGRVAELKSARKDCALRTERQILDERIEAAQMESDPNILNFTALSYCWGAELPEYDILVTSGDHSGWFSVRQNLYHFLQQRRQENTPSPLYWIDQICINQSDDDEKGLQVNQMAELYSSATTVEVWLGSGFEGSDRLVDLIICAKEKVDPSQRSIAGFSGSIQEQRELLPSIRHLVNLPYWSRVWIIQELVLARSISICIKAKRVPWTTFRLGWIAFLDLCSPDGNYFPDLTLVIRECPTMLSVRLEAIDFTRQSLTDRSWLNAVFISYDTDCFDYKDRVFGVMGMVAPQFRFHCDYSMEPQELVYMIFSREMEEERAKLEYYDYGLRRFDKHCVRVAGEWFRILDPYSDGMDRISVCLQLLEVLLPHYGDSALRFWHYWYFVYYVWYQIPHGQSKAWRLAHVGEKRVKGIKDRCKSGSGILKKLFGKAPEGKPQYSFGTM